MLQRWRWATLLVLIVALWVGCGSSEKDQPNRPGSGGKAGNAGAATSGTTAEGGGAGDPDEPSAGDTATGGRVGGSAGASGSGVVAGSTGFVPLSWTCAAKFYGDGKCHCGCGIVDSDCPDSSRDGCEVCDEAGSCNTRACPGRIDENVNSLCVATPPSWRCAAELYLDGKSCDCGCGAFDPDCDDPTADSCDRCDAEGSCSKGDCPSVLDPEQNAVCIVPPEWSCLDSLFNDGRCDCGCTLQDIDCASVSISECVSCASSSCSLSDCSTLQADDNTVCTVAPARWTCPDRFYNDGEQCDCGCGYVDPDCGRGIELRDCDKCDHEGSCSLLACPGVVDPTDLAHCTDPPPPPEWECGTTLYSDGLCDCGCGVQDVDCRTTDDIRLCYRCYACGAFGCPANVDPDDTARCLPPPSGWSCDGERFGDGYCDCGCGVHDVDCLEVPGYCSNFPEEGCSHGNPDLIDPVDNTRCTYEIPDAWTCDDDFYFDGTCDCGCGTQDGDCETLSRDECQVCDSEGSCSDEDCDANEIALDDNASCVP